MTGFVGREYGILDLIHLVEEDDDYLGLRRQLEGWVRAVAEQLAAEAGGEVEYAEIKEVLLRVPEDD